MLSPQERAEIPEPKSRRARWRTTEAVGRVAIILAVGMVTALNLVTVALLYAAVIRLGIDSTTGLSDNGVQVLLAWGGGIISVLAGFVGYIIGDKKSNGHEPAKPAEPPPT